MWLVIAGAGYLIVSTAFLLAMGRAAARGDARHGRRGAHPRAGPRPSNGPDSPSAGGSGPTPPARPLDYAS